MKERISPYLPGIAMFFVTLVIGLLVYKDYGIAWDEPLQRGPGLLSYNYAFHGNQELFQKATDNHGAGYEILLIIFEKWMKLTDTRDIFLMRHLVTHILFLAGALAAYVLSFRLFRNKFLACLGFLLIVAAPRMYAHSFFNSKDLPFLSMMIISFACLQYAFEKNKMLPFLLLGILVGYATSIRIMGIMLASFVIFFLVVDLITGISKKEKPVKPILNILAFIGGFCILLVGAWPYLWKSPVHNFVESFSKLSRFELWNGSILLGGKYIQSTQLPWTYFFTWFFISNPILWLIGGIAGMCLIISAFFKKPLDFLRNTRERNFILYVLCFGVPIFAVLFLKSIIYDDWRHLYFIYPSFIMMVLYAVNKLIENDYVVQNKKYIMAVQGLCLAQVAGTAWFMVQNHPFQQVYMNKMVSHDEEFIRKNYEMDYWGVSNLQALKHILENDQRKLIKVTAIFPEILQNNIDMLEPEDRSRLKLLIPDSSDYLITNFRFHPDDFPFNEDYSFMVQNSTVIRIYKMRNVSVNFR